MTFPLDDKGGRRARLERELMMIRQELAPRRMNAVRGFAYVRDSYPEAAKILYCGRDLQRTDLKNADLTDIDFCGSNLSGCDFTNARIAGARFDFTKISRGALAKARDWQAYLENWQPRDSAAPISFQREPSERFGFAPFLPEVIILPPDLFSEAEERAAENEAVLGLSDAERQFLSMGRLAVAIRCLNRAEWTRVVDPGRAEVDSNRSMPIRSYAANAYCNELTRNPQQFGLPHGTRVAMPSFALFHAMAIVGESDGADCVLSDKTDLSLDDLGIGAGQDAEFVERWSHKYPSAITAAKLLHAEQRSGNIRLFQPPPARALLRPIFFLGEGA